MAYLSSNQSLGANATWTSGTKLTDRADSIVGSVFADQAGTLYVDQSFDNTNWDISESTAVAAGAGTKFKHDLIAPHIRLRYVNGATAQGAFRLHARFSSAGDS